MEAAHRQATLALLEQLTKAYRDPENPHIKVLPVWHGTKKEILADLFETGFANLAQIDSGFFGKGLYGTMETKYSYRCYCKGALLVNWVVFYSAYPTIDGDMPKLAGVANFENYDAHFVPVVSQNPHNSNKVNYFPCKPGQKHTYSDRIVIANSRIF